MIIFYVTIYDLRRKKKEKKNATIFSIDARKKATLFEKF